MRCRSCDYPLWNLVNDTCPECGEHYAPSQYAFVPGSVKFICPSCDQQYFGTSKQGHLQPQNFQCVGCGEQLGMDSMRLQPADGWEEELTTAATAPWGNPQYGRVRRFFSTIGWAHVKPAAFMKGLPLDTKIVSAWGFFLVLQFLCALITVAPMLIFAFAMVLSGSNTQRGMGTFTSAMILLFLGWMLVLVLGALVWSLLTHATLRVTGGSAHSYGRTLCAILFSSGTLVMTAVPCLGVQCLTPFAVIWWIVSAALMVTAAQRVSGLRGSLAAIWPPGIAIVVLVALYIFAIFGVTTARGVNPGVVGMGQQLSSGETIALQNVATQLRAAQVGVQLPEGAVIYTWPESIFDLDWGDGASTQDFGQLMNDGRLLEVVRRSVAGEDSGREIDVEELVEFPSTYGNLTEEQLEQAMAMLRNRSVRGEGYEEFEGLIYCMPGAPANPLGDMLADRWLLAAVVPSGDGFTYNLVVITTNNAVSVYTMDQVPAALRWEEARREEDELPSISGAILDAIESETSMRLDLAD